MLRRCPTFAMLTLIGWAAIAPIQSAQADTLADVRARGAVHCGVGEVPGFAMRSESGDWSGFWIDICRAIAAATLGDADHIMLTAAESLTPFEALTAGEVDLLTEGTTWTIGRESQDLAFPVVYYFDGQAFLTTKAANIATVADLAKASICVVANTTTQRNLDGYLRTNAIPAKVITVESHTKAWESFTKGRCNVITHDLVILKAMLSVNFSDPEDYSILPETISREPTGPVVRNDDRKWAEIVRWTVLAMIAAEQLDVTSQNLDTFAASEDLQIMALTGRGEDHAKALGLQPGWMRRVIAQVGNYGEIFERSLTRQLGLTRGRNALWRDGGYMYAPPLY